MHNPHQATIHELETLIQRLNKTLGAPPEYSTNAAVGTSKPLFQTNPGHLYLERSNGNFNLYRVANTAGAANLILFASTKRELRAKLHALFTGINLGRNY